MSSGARKNSPNLQKISSIVTAGSASLTEAEPSIPKLNEDQIAQVLSALWIQASLPENLPNPRSSLVVCFFHFPLALMKMSLYSNLGSLPPAYQRSVFVLSAAMLMFAAKIYQVDDYVGISDDFQLYVKPQTDIREYSSPKDSKEAEALLSHLRSKLNESEKILLNILVESLSNITGEFPSNLFSEDDAMSESSVTDPSHFIPRMPMSPLPPLSHVVNIGQSMELALEVAGQVAGTSVSTSPLPYSTRASQCEALGTDTRKKLSNWLTHESRYAKATDVMLPPNPAYGILAIKRASTSVHLQITSEDTDISGVEQKESWLSLRLPPACPFDNFLRAVRC